MGERDLKKFNISPYYPKYYINNTSTIFFFLSIYLTSNNIHYEINFIIFSFGSINNEILKIKNYSIIICIRKL